MGRYRTRAGVVIEMRDDAARAVGYLPAEEQVEKKPRATRGRKKAEDKPAEDSAD